MIAALLLAVAAPGTAVDAERAFAADAQRLGQWTAFRRWAAPDAVMFDPQPVSPHVALKDASNPPQSVSWWPTAGYVACDGATAVNTGGWERSDGTFGYFTTVWRRQPDGGWRWELDAGDVLKERRAKPARPLVRHATCPARPIFAGHTHAPPPESGMEIGDVFSSDASLLVRWQTYGNGAGRTLTVALLTRRGFETVIVDRVAAPPAKTR